MHNHHTESVSAALAQLDILRHSEGLSYDDLAELVESPTTGEHVYAVIGGEVHDAGLLAEVMIVLGRRLSRRDHGEG